MGIKANIFNIQHFSVHDGPGVRTVVFFKGCSLHCRWCHNPESIHAAKEILLYPDRCIGCMACREVCPVGAQVFDETGHWIDRSKCIHCFKCCEECYADALVSVGEWRNTGSILKEILENKGYFDQSKGGVTFSGGECMLQPDALTELLKGCQAAGVHTAVDTAGNVLWESFEQVLPYTDLFLYDIKAMDSDVHKTCTGVGNERILENIKQLAELSARVVIRIPTIEGVNADEENIRKSGEFVKKYLPRAEMELLPYHKFGFGKYEALGMDLPDAAFGTPTKEKMEHLKGILREIGISLADFK